MCCEMVIKDVILKMRKYCIELVGIFVKEKVRILIFLIKSFVFYKNICEVKI